MKYIRELNDADKVNYICVICNLIIKNTTYHLIEFGGFYRTLCDNCYQTFKSVIDKPEQAAPEEGKFMRICDRCKSPDPKYHNVYVAHRNCYMCERCSKELEELEKVMNSMEKTFMKNKNLKDISCIWEE